MDISPVRLPVGLLVEQQQAADRLIDQIAQRMSNGGGACDLWSTHLRLLRLGSLLRSHFELVDTIVYPRLLASHDRSRAIVVQALQLELGGVSQDLETYLSRWSILSQAAADRARFESETQLLFARLRRRFDRETDFLFPLLDMR